MVRKEHSGDPKERDGDAPIRVLAYCHDGVGLGHLRRTLNICERLSTAFPRSTYLVATGNPYVSLFHQLPQVDYLKLPSLRKISNEVYVPKFLNLKNGALQCCRQALLLETAKHFEPDVVLVDKAPVGVCGELTQTLKWLREHRPATSVVFGMRDIEDAPTATLDQWSRLDVPRMLEDYFDEVWVYGMREVFDVASEYRLSPRVREKLRFMGYVSRCGCTHDACDPPLSPLGKGGGGGSPKRQVLVTVGGGTDGGDILDAYLSGPAERVAEAGASSLVVAGPDLPADQATRLRRRAADFPSVRWVDFTPCLSCEVSRSALVVCMGGYNTLCEVVAAGRPALVIPRTHPRIEQALRARLWERLGLVRVMERTRLTTAHFGEEIIRTLTMPPTAPAGTLDMRGLDRVCERFGALLNGRAPRAAGLPV